MDLGNRIRFLREMKGITMAKVAKECGLSTGYISLIERDLVNPSISTLKKISNFLDIPLAGLFNENGQDDIFENMVVVRADKRQRRRDGKADSEIAILSPNNPNNKLDFFMMISKPGAKSSDLFHNHGKGEECGYILEGELEVYINNQKITLYKGDSIQFRTEMPHHWVNGSNKDTISIWVMSTR